MKMLLLTIKKEIKRFLPLLLSKLFFYSLTFSTTLPPGNICFCHLHNKIPCIRSHGKAPGKKKKKKIEFLFLYFFLHPKFYTLSLPFFSTSISLLLSPVSPPMLLNISFKGTIFDPEIPRTLSISFAKSNSRKRQREQGPSECTSLLYSPPSFPSLSPFSQSPLFHFTYYFFLSSPSFSPSLFLLVWHPENVKKRLKSEIRGPVSFLLFSPLPFFLLFPSL